MGLIPQQLVTLCPMNVSGVQRTAVLFTWNEAVLVGPGTTWDWVTFPVKERLSTDLEFWRLLGGGGLMERME